MTPPVANIIFPYVVDLAAWMVLAFVPAVIVESAIVRAGLGIRWPRALGWVFLANLLTTVVGGPLAWGVLEGSRRVGLALGASGQRAILLESFAGIPALRYPVLLWASIVTIWLVLYVLTAYLESLVLRRALREVARGTIIRRVWIANAVSYAGLAALLLIQNGFHWYRDLG